MPISGGKSMFVSSVDCSGDEKTGEFISELLLEAIEKVGTYNVVQVLTDNATNCRRAGETIESRHPHISWSGCMAHILSLLIKDMVKPNKHMVPLLPVVANVYEREKKIVDYIKHHTLAQFIFRTFSKLDVLQTKKTRFGSHYVMLERVFRVKNQLISMVTSEDWEKIKKGRSKKNTECDQLKKTVLDDEFWEKANFVLSFTKPIWYMIRFCDSDKAVIGLVYVKMWMMLESIKAALVNHVEMQQVVENLVTSRWEMMNLPLHCLAYSHPYFHSQAWLKGDPRKKAHADNYVDSVYLDKVDDIVRDPTERMIVRHQLSDFLSCRGIFASPQAIVDREKMTAIAWWGMYGVTTIELHNLALKVLSQSVNSSCSERAWSTFSYIHNVKRNNMNSTRADAFVFIHYNQRLLSRYRNDYEEGYKNWDAYTNNECLDFDIEVVEESERSVLFDVDVTSLEATISRAQGESDDIADERRRKISRGKRARKE